MLAPRVLPLLTAAGLLLPLQLNGCRGDLAETLASDAGGAGGAEAQGPTAQELFDQQGIPVFRFSLPDAAWENLKATAAEEEYAPAELYYGDELVGEVGLRFKGSFGTLTLCIDEVTGELTCSKLSMKVKFSEYDKEQRFYGLKRLNFHGMSRDPSKLHEKVAYKMYRDMGVAAPRTHWARLEVNGENLGLFSMVEQIDGRFTKDRFSPEGDGNLYKEVWPSSSDPEHYQEKLKTNEDTATHAGMISFASALAKSGAGDSLGALDAYASPEQIYRYMAVDDAIAAWDGVTAWYCSDWGCAPHNFYWYQAESEARFTLVPWDMDSTLSASTPFAEVPHWSVVPDDCDQRWTIFGNVQVSAPGCSPFFQALQSERGRYESAVQEVLDEHFVLDSLHADIERYASLIEEEVGADPTLSGVSAWRSSVDALKDELPLLRERLEALQAGQPTAPLVLSTLEVNDFEALSGLSVALGLEVYSNDTTVTQSGLATSDALQGGQDLLVSYTFNNQGTDAWGQWIDVRLGLSRAPVDLSSLTGLRLRLATDGARDVRLGLDSPQNSASDSGVRFGWDLQVNQSEEVYEVLFSEALHPNWAPSLPDLLEDILAEVTDLTLSPSARRDESGMLLDASGDEGYLRIDDVEFF